LRAAARRPAGFVARSSHTAPGYSSSLAPRQRAWGPAAKCEFISARALSTPVRKSMMYYRDGLFPRSQRNRVHQPPKARPRISRISFVEFVKFVANLSVVVKKIDLIQ